MQGWREEQVEKIKGPSRNLRSEWNFGNARHIKPRVEVLATFWKLYMAFISTQLQELFLMQKFYL